MWKHLEIKYKDGKGIKGKPIQQFRCGECQRIDYNRKYPRSPYSDETIDAALFMIQTMTILQVSEKLQIKKSTIEGWTSRYLPESQKKKGGRFLRDEILYCIGDCLYEGKCVVSRGGKFEVCEKLRVKRA